MSEKKNRFLVDGEFLKRERQERNITLKDDADTFGVSARQVRRIESGNTSANRRTLGLESVNSELLEKLLAPNDWKYVVYPSKLEAIEDVASVLDLDWLDLVTHKLVGVNKDADVFRPIPRTSLGIIDGTDVASSFEQIKEYVRGSAASGLAYMTDNPMLPMDIARIIDFWRPEIHATLTNRLVATKGTLSEFAPLLAGPPYLKRSIHLDYRNRRERAELSADQVNANLSFTAGQMVWKFNTDWFEWVYMGLYQSIVRNSIPVFVSKPYFESFVKPQLAAKESTAVECELVGHAVPLKAFSALLKSLRIPMNVLRPEVMAFADNALTHGLFVDGSSGTHISLKGISPYLDGDIWSYVKTHNGDDGVRHRLISRFPNLADPQDVADAREEIQQDIEHALRTETLIERVDYDESDPFNVESHTSTKSDMLKRLNDE